MAEFESTSRWTARMAPDRNLRWRARAVALATALWLAASAPVPAASAQDVDSIGLSWEAPATCPDERTIRERVQTHLPEDYRPQRPLVAHARVIEEHGRLRLELTLRGDGSDAHKTLRSTSCESLADAAALLIALALDPRAVADGGAHAAAEGDRAAVGRDESTGPDGTSTSAASTRAKPPAQSSAARSVQARAPDRRRPPHRANAAPEPSSAAPAVRLGVGIGAALQSGMLPATPAAGLRAEGVVMVARVRAAAGLTLFPDTGIAIESHARGRLDAGGLIGALEVGFDLIAMQPRLQPCALLELGEFWAETSGISSPAAATTTWIAAGGGLHGGYRIGDHLELAIEALAVAPFARPRWWLQTPPGEIEVFTASPVGFRAHAGVVYVF